MDIVKQASHNLKQLETLSIYKKQNRDEWLAFYLVGSFGSLKVENDICYLDLCCPICLDNVALPVSDLESKSDVCCKNCDITIRSQKKVSAWKRGDMVEVKW